MNLNWWATEEGYPTEDGYHYTNAVNAYVSLVKNFTNYTSELYEDIQDIDPNSDWYAGWYKSLW